DSRRIDILDKKVILLATDAVFENAVRLHVPDGIPLSEKYPSFQICHDNATSMDRMMLQVTAKQTELPITTWAIVLICTVTLIISGYCSGTNFAYMRMSINDMALIMENGQEPHKTHARKIFKYRKQSNWLICTMAAMNILVNTIFTLGISWLVEPTAYGDILKFVIPTIMIVMLGEIVPQSICNRFGLEIAASTRHITLLLFIICAPVAYPLSRIIDYVLGREVREIYSEEKLEALIKVQSKQMEEAAQGDIIARIADFPKKTVEEMMTPIEDAFILSSSDTLDQKLLAAILEKGYTRIPVYEERNKSNISTVLNVKACGDLATSTIDRNWKVKDVISQCDDARTQMRFVLASQKGEAVMQEMMKGEHHLCGVIRFAYGRYKIVGIITFEDVIEEVFGEIEDDSDKLWNSRRAGIHKDQQTLDWFRETEEERGPALPVNAMLKLIQTIFAVCPLFASLGYDIWKMKGLLDVKKLKFADEDDIIKIKDSQRMVIFYSGTISVHSGKVAMYRLDANRADFRPYIWGKSIVKHLFKKRLHSLSCLGEPLGHRTYAASPEIRCLSKVAYYEITTSDIIEGLREPDDVGYGYYRQYNTTNSESRKELNIIIPKMEAESTQLSYSHNITPKQSMDRVTSVVTNKFVKPSELRSRIERLQKDVGASPQVSVIVTPEKPDITTARELVVRPGPPLKSIASTPTQKSKQQNGGKSSSGRVATKGTKHYERQPLNTGKKAKTPTKAKEDQQPNSNENANFGKKLKLTRRKKFLAQNVRRRHY
ncbi:unnamed protein product, partial [Cylicocyclus nassatus]